MTTDRFHITLIHGTFARGAGWVKEGSGLREHLVSHLPGTVEFDNFCWSGWPSHIARRKAAIRLHSHMTQTIADNPTAAHFIVAHSHGGMVALYALRDEALAERVEGVVTLSTPFLVRRGRNLSIFGKVGVEAVPRLLLPVAITYFLALFFHDAIAFWAFWLLSLFFAVLILAIGDYYYRLSRRWLNATLDLPRLREGQLYVVRGPADEAYALLLATQFFQWIVSSIWGRRGLFHATVTNIFGFIRKAIDWIGHLKFYRHVVFLLFMFWIGYGFLWHYDIIAPIEYLVPPFDVFDAAAPLGPKLYYAVFGAVMLLLLPLPIVGITLIVLILVLGIIIVPVALLASTILMLPIAPEVGPFSTSLDISVEALPPGECMVKQIEPQQGGSGLLHSVTYNDPAALQAIANWMLRKEKDSYAI